MDTTIPKVKSISKGEEKKQTPGHALYEGEKNAIEKDARTNLSLIYPSLQKAGNVSEAVDLLADAMFIIIVSHQNRLREAAPNINYRVMVESSRLAIGAILKSINNILIGINTTIIQKSDVGGEQINTEWIEMETISRLEDYEERLYKKIARDDFKRLDRHIGRLFDRVTDFAKIYIGAINEYTTGISENKAPEYCKTLLIKTLAPLKAGLPKTERDARHNLSNIHYYKNIDADVANLELARAKTCVSYRRVMVLSAQMRKIMPQVPLLIDDLKPASVASKILAIEEKISVMKLELSPDDASVTLGNLLDPQIEGPKKVKAVADAAEILEKQSFVHDVEELEGMLLRYYRMLRENSKFSEYAYKPTPIIQTVGNSVTVHGIPLSVWEDKEENKDAEMVEKVIADKQKYSRGIMRANNRMLSLGSRINASLTPALVGTLSAMEMAYINGLGVDKRNLLFALYKLKVTVDKLRLLKDTPAYRTVQSRKEIKDRALDVDALLESDRDALGMRITALGDTTPLGALSKSDTGLPPTDRHIT